MTDAFGTDLAVGDWVVYCTAYKGTFLYRGVVTGFIESESSPRVIIGKRGRVARARVYRVCGNPYTEVKK